MSGAGFAGLGYDGGLVDSVPRDAANQQNQWSADIKAVVHSPASASPAAPASPAAAADATPPNAALNQNLPGASGRIGGGPQQAADGYGHQSGSTTDPLSAANAMPTIDQAMGGESPDTGQFRSSLAQGPLPRQVTDALSAAGYNSRGSTGQTVEVTAEAQSRPDAEPSALTPAVPDPAGSSGQAALPGVPSTAIDGAQPAALASVGSGLFGTGVLGNAPAGALAPGAPDTLQQALAATATGPQQAAVTAAVTTAPNGAPATLPLSGPSLAVLGGVAIPSVGDFAGPSPPAMPTPIVPVAGVTGMAFTAGATVLPGPVTTGGAPAMPDIGVANASGTAVPTLNYQAVAGLALPFVAPATKTGPAPLTGGAAIAQPAVSGETESVMPVAPIPGSLTPNPPLPAQTPPLSPDAAAEGAPVAAPPGTPLGQTTPLPGLTTQPAPAGLVSPLAARPAAPVGLLPGAWAFGFGPLPAATPQALLTPGIATSTNSRGQRSVEGGVIAYAEHRAVLLDLAPVEPQVPSWRLDDTQALVSVGAAGVAPARGRAVALYSALMEQGEGLAAVRPGEGFVTWEGSPLWLSLAGIAKPGQHGVLPNVAVPGRVQVQRTITGEWLVEHTGRPSPTSRPLRHDAAAADDESLLSDVLYGVTALRADGDRARRFERALSALRFAFGLAPPARWRSAEAWASVARLCAVSAMHVDDVLKPSAEAALQAALSVIVSGLAPSPPKDALSVPPLSRDRFLRLALSGDGEHIVVALKGLGRAALDRLRRGVVDDLDRLDTLALAVCLGRLARTIPQSPSNATASSRRGAGPTARPVLARSVSAGRRW